MQKRDLTKPSRVITAIPHYERVERYRRHVEKTVAKTKQWTAATIPPSWYEEVEHRPFVEIVLARIVLDRGLAGGKLTPEQRRNLETDDIYDDDARKGHTRTRDVHYGDVALLTVGHYLAANGVPLRSNADIHRLIRKFYLCGDDGLLAAIARAVKAAIDDAPDARTKASPR